MLGSCAPWAGMVRDLVKDWAGREESTVWGHSLRVPSPNAAFANAIAANAVEIDDTYTPGVVHPGCVVIPAAFAVAETSPGFTGKDLVLSVLCGYEAMARVSASLGSSQMTRLGRYNPSVCGIVGAALGAGKALNLDGVHLAYSLSIATSCAGGLFSRSMAKRISNGYAAKGGVTSALLAQKGVIGATDALEAEHGSYLGAFSDDPRPIETTSQLGQVFKTDQVSYKRYSCGWPIFSALDCVKEIMRKEARASGPVNDILRIEVKTSKFVNRHAGKSYEDYDRQRAMHSMPFCISLLMSTGDVFVESFSHQSLNNPEIVGLAKRVKVVETREFEKPERRWDASVKIFFKNGEWAEETAYSSSETAADVKSFVEMKFRKVSSYVLDGSRTEELVRAVAALEHARNINTLIGLIGPGIDTTPALEF